MECWDSHEKTLATRTNNNKTYATRGSIEPVRGLGPREPILSLEKSIILVVYILQMCIRKRRLRFDEKLNVLQVLVWIVRHTEFEGLIAKEQNPQPLESIFSLDNDNITRERHLLN